MGLSGSRGLCRANDSDKLGCNGEQQETTTANGRKSMLASDGAVLAEYQRLAFGSEALRWPSLRINQGWLHDEEMFEILFWLVVTSAGLT